MAGTRAGWQALAARGSGWTVWRLSEGVGGQACRVSFCLTGLGAGTVERKVGGRFGLLTVIDTRWPKTHPLTRRAVLMSTHADRGAASADHVGARELALEVAGLIGRETLAPLLDARQAAAILNVPASWIAAEARAGRIPHVRLGRYVRFNRDELMCWCDGRSVGPRPRRQRRP